MSHSAYTYYYPDHFDKHLQWPFKRTFQYRLETGKNLCRASKTLDIDRSDRFCARCGNAGHSITQCEMPTLNFFRT